MLARPRVDFIYTKNFRAVIHRGTMRQKIAIFKEGDSVWRGTTFFSDLILSTQRIFRGAMRQKIAIFKERIYVTAIFRTRSWFVLKTTGGDATENGIIGGRCDRKWRFSKRKTAFAGVQKISEVLFYIQQALIIDNNFFKLQLCDFLVQLIVAFSSFSSARTARLQFWPWWSTSNSFFMQWSRHSFHFAAAQLKRQAPADF